VQPAQDVRDVIGGDIGVLRAAQIEEGCDAPSERWQHSAPVRKDESQNQCASEIHLNKLRC
jgi:hypothetical protein